MAISTTDKEFLKYFTQLDELQKKSLLTMLKTFLKANHVEQGRTSVEQYNRELEEAMAQVQRGDVYTHDEVIKMSKDW